MQKKNKTERTLSQIKLKHSPYLRNCNICDQHFEPRSHFDRYCSHCKGRSDLLRFSDWLPDLDLVLTHKIEACA